MKANIRDSESTTSPPSAPVQRGDWAERQTEDILSRPFVREFVFRDVRTMDGGTLHQVGDFLILNRGSGILVEQKCQEDPTTRTSTKTELWARKKAKEGWNQLGRALKRPKDRPIWCDHQRRGRVELPEGLPVIRHGVVMVEVFQTVDLEPDVQSLPLEFRGVPITYLSVNDFLNLAVSLRTVPELTEYLAARRSLPHHDLRTIGDEWTLFLFYLLNGGSFAGCLGRADARITVAARQHQIRKLLERKVEADRYASLLEYVADSLATRHPDFEAGLPGDLLVSYDPTDQRRNYLEMQAELADLGLRERAELGRALHNASERLASEAEGFVFMAARLDSKPEWVYIFASSKGVGRNVVMSRITPLMRGAMAYYEKRRCLLVLDRDGATFEVALSRPDFNPTLADFEVGQRLFGHLRVTSTPMELVPERRA